MCALRRWECLITRLSSPDPVSSGRRDSVRAGAGSAAQAVSSRAAIQMRHQVNILPRCFLPDGRLNANGAANLFIRKPIVSLRMSDWLQNGSEHNVPLEF